MRTILHLFAKLLDEILPLPRCLFDEWEIRRRIREGEDAPLGDDDRIYMTLDLGDLKESHKAALGLREQLQRRAQGYLMAVTVASSFTIGMLALFAKVQPDATAAAHPSGTSRALLLAVLASFLMSAFSALCVLRPSDVYDLWLRSQVPNDPEQKKANLIRFTQLNEAYAMAYARHARGSYVGMRNGVVVLFVWLATLIAFPGALLQAPKIGGRDAGSTTVGPFQPVSPSAHGSRGSTGQIPPPP